MAVFKQWLILYKKHLVLFFCCVIAYSLFYVLAVAPFHYATGHYISSWPDETANYFFTQHFINNSDFLYPEPLNIALQNAVHPRSANVLGPFIVPMGFLGLPILFGLLGKITLGYGLFLFTPILAAGGVLGFYSLVKSLFSEQLAWWAAWLMAFFPGYWYFANLGFLPNVLFVALLFIGLGLFAKLFLKNDDMLLRAVFAGLFLGLALTVRPVEAIWLVPAIIAAILLGRKTIARRSTLIFILFFILGVSVLALGNWTTYGSPWYTGYLDFENQGGILDKLPGEFSFAENQEATSLGQLLFAPFGFNAREILRNFIRYFLLLYWPYVILAGSGTVLLIRNWRQNKISRPQLFYFLAVASVACWFAVYYGSWHFADALVLKHNTIASSYSRYFLPLGVFGVPFVAYFLNELTKRKKWQSIALVTAVLLVSGLNIFSIKTVWFTALDGLAEQKTVIADYYHLYEAVRARLPLSAVIVCDREDKIFFPVYRVVMFNYDYRAFAKLAGSVNNYDFYYITRLVDNDINYLNEHKINEYGLRLSNSENLTGNFRLFKITSISHE